MLRFQFEVALTLAISACGSLAVFYLTRKKEGKIQIDDSSYGHDPFDVTCADDVVDGYPIEGDAFWATVCGFPLGHMY
jgi:hypothetical protein